MRWFGMLLVGVIALLGAGCGVLEVGDIGGEDDDVSADDDAADDDDTAADDDAADDDDTAADDDAADDDDVPEPRWLHISYAMDLTGGEPAASGYLYVTVTAYEGTAHAVGDEICSQTVAYWSEAVVGAGLADDRFWQGIDVTISWGGQPYEIEDTCPWSPDDLFGEPWDQAMQWDDPAGPAGNPLGFVSCASIAADAALADAVVGPDPYQFTEAATFGEHCDLVGAYLQDNYGTGSMEGVWLGPMAYGTLGGDFGYFEAQNGGVYFGYMGWLLNDPTNAPGSGLDGVYITVTPWIHDA